MNKVLTNAGFALIVSLSGLSAAHAAGFNDRGPVIDAGPSRAARPDSSHVATVHGFNQQSHHTSARVTTSGMGRADLVASDHCDLPPRFGFNNSFSFSSC
ncbi:MAG TPA: hypothetical protein PLU26_07140 [Candidatus Competibacter sp.]|nr:hypothetical protein [Candidatus Competibacteraceae bacterium]HUM94236.1 hypothetical protein [Candidatus Competibacter sp.]